MWKRILIILLILSLFIVSNVFAKTIRLVIGQQKSISLEKPANRVDSGNAKVLGASAKDAYNIVATARGPGYTTLTITYRDGTEESFPVIVEEGLPAEELALEIGRLLEDTEIDIAVAGGKIVLTGEIYTWSDVHVFATVLSLYEGQVVNLVKDNVPRYLVQMDVKIVEVKSDDMKEIGVDWLYANSMKYNANFTNKERGVEYNEWVAKNGAIDFAEEDVPQIIPNPNRIVGDIFRFPLSARLNLLAEKGKAKILAKPKMIAKSGEEASFRVGGEIPVVPIGLGGGKIEWKEFGVIMQMEPVVRANGMINLTLDGEVSQLDWANAVHGVPAIRIRNIIANIDLRDGETIAIAGLIQTTTDEQKKGIPILKDIPFFGGLLFGSTLTEVVEVETIIIVSLMIVKDESKLHEPILPIYEDLNPCDDHKEGPCR